MNQPLVALASPDPRHIKAQLRHTKSEFDTFLAQCGQRREVEISDGCIQASNKGVVSQPSGLSGPTRSDVFWFLPS
jgi:hypothetical protein